MKEITLVERLALSKRRIRRNKVKSLELTLAERQVWVERAMERPPCAKTYVQKDVCAAYQKGEEYRLRLKMQVEDRWSWVELMRRSILFPKPRFVPAKPVEPRTMRALFSRKQLVKLGWIS